MLAAALKRPACAMLAITPPIPPSFPTIFATHSTTLAKGLTRRTVGLSRHGALADARHAQREAIKLAMPLPVRRRNAAAAQPVETHSSFVGPCAQDTSTSCSADLSAAPMNFLMGNIDEHFREFLRAQTLASSPRSLASGASSESLFASSTMFNVESFISPDDMFKMLDRDLHTYATDEMFNVVNFSCADDLFTMLDRDFVSSDRELPFVLKDIALDISTAISGPLPCRKTPDAACASPKGVKHVQWASDSDVKSDVRCEEVEWTRMKRRAHCECERSRKQHDKRIALERYAASMSPTRRRCNASSSHVQRMRASQVRTRQ